jgi:hypothetical protein
MTARDPDRLINEWLREELDAVPEPTRAVRGAIDASVLTPQRRGRWGWLRQLLGREGSVTQLGSAARPEIVLQPGGGQQGAAAAGLQGQRAISLPLVLGALALAVALLLGFGYFAMSLEQTPQAGTSDGRGPTPLRPLDDGPNRVIAVGADAAHFTTIADAVAVALPGDRIELQPGTYREHVVIEKDITVTGVGDRGSIIVEPAALAAGTSEGEEMRNVFELYDSDATLEGFTVRGSDFGTSISVDGGAPLLVDLVVSPEGTQRAGSPSRPRHSIVARGGTALVLRDSRVTGLMAIDDGATPLLDNNEFETTCVLAEEEGTVLTIRGTSFVDSECPGFSVSVAKGASAKLEQSQIRSLPENAGIRVGNEGSDLEISGTTIEGGLEGVLATSGARLTIRRSLISEAAVGVRVSNAEATLDLNELTENKVGLEVSGDSYFESIGNVICDNTVDLDLRDGASYPIDQNETCAS